MGALIGALLAISLKKLQERIEQKDLVYERGDVHELKKNGGSSRFYLARPLILL
jgi:hypothetical protein